MKISKSEPHYVLFEKVKFGDVFLWGGDYYIKLSDLLYSDDDRCGYNCVMISCGDAGFISDMDTVELVNGEFKIY